MILVQDSVLGPKEIHDTRESALQSGFGNWTPKSSEFGGGTYSGMNWKGYHGACNVALTRAVRRQVFPNSMFFRVLLEDAEPRLIHSDQLDGNYTAILYLSEHEEESGTAFYRHKETDLLVMPTMEEMKRLKTVGYWRKEMANEDAWEQTDYIRGQRGRMLVFSAGLFHGRVPANGIGKTPEEGRMIWVCHFYTPEDLLNP